MNKAIIIKFIAGVYTIYNQETKEIFLSKPRGVLKIKGIIPKVGDNVTYDVIDEKSIPKVAAITSVEKRHNDLIRPNIANIDQALVVFSVKEPDLNLNLLDKFLVNLEYSQIKPIIIFSKWDLLSKDEEESINKIVSYYEKIGYQIIITSNKNSQLEQIKEVLKNKISVLTGQSGVGKSSLLNLLDSTLNLETNVISYALGRGKHTTRHVELYLIDNALVADTPGFGSLDFDGLDEASLAQNFVEFFSLSKTCKYNGCLHLNEPGCMVKQKVKENEILNSRYENYLSFNKIIKENKKY